MPVVFTHIHTDIYNQTEYYNIYVWSTYSLYLSVPFHHINNVVLHINLLYSVVLPKQNLNGSSVL